MIPLYASTTVDPYDAVKYYANNDQSIVGAAISTQIAINEVSALNRDINFPRYEERFRVKDDEKSFNPCLSCICCIPAVFTLTTVIIENGILTCPEMKKCFKVEGSEILEPDLIIPDCCCGDNDPEVRLMFQFSGSQLRLKVEKQKHDEFLIALEANGAVGITDVYLHDRNNKFHNKHRLGPTGTTTIIGMSP